MIGTMRREGVVAAVLCFTAVHVVLAGLDAPALSPAGRVAYVGSLAVVVAAVVTALVRWPSSLAHRRSLGWAVVAATVLATLLVLSVLPDDARGFSLWFVSLAPVPLSGVALRGLPASALTGAVGNAGAVVGWSAATSAGLVSGVYRVVTPTAVVVVAIWIAGFVQRSRRSVAAAHAERADALRIGAATRAADAERRRRIAEVERLTGPVLLRLADGGTVDEQLAAECRLLEASLRDDIRVPALATTAVREAAWSARTRGVEVRLLDVSRERGPERVADPVAVALRRCLVRVLEELDSGTVTARLSRDGVATLVVVSPQVASLVDACQGVGTGPADGVGRDTAVGVGRDTAVGEAEGGGAAGGVERELEVIDSGELLATFHRPEREETGG